MKDDQRRAIAQRVREARRATGLSQESLGAKIGLTKVGYGDYERGQRLFDTDMLFQLSRILGRPVTWFLGLDTGLTEDEARVLELYRQANAAGQGAAALGVLEALTRVLRA